MSNRIETNSKTLSIGMVDLQLPRVKKAFKHKISQTNCKSRPGDRDYLRINFLRTHGKFREARFSFFSGTLGNFPAIGRWDVNYGFVYFMSRGEIIGDYGKLAYRVAMRKTGVLGIFSRVNI